MVVVYNITQSPDPQALFILGLEINLARSEQNLYLQLVIILFVTCMLSIQFSQLFEIGMDPGQELDYSKSLLSFQSIKNYNRSLDI